MKVLIVYYSTYGHVHQMAEAIAEGVREVAGAEAVLRRVPDLRARLAPRFATPCTTSKPYDCAGAVIVDRGALIYQPGQPFAQRNETSA